MGCRPSGSLFHLDGEGARGVDSDPGGGILDLSCASLFPRPRPLGSSGVLIRSSSDVC